MTDWPNGDMPKVVGSISTDKYSYGEHLCLFVQRYLYVQHAKILSYNVCTMSFFKSCHIDVNALPDIGTRCHLSGIHNCYLSKYVYFAQECYFIIYDCLITC